MNVAIAAKVCVIFCLVLEVQCSEKRQSDSCSDPNSYFSSYCVDVLTNPSGIDAQIVCTDCIQEVLDYFKDCVEPGQAELLEEECTSLGYPPPPTPQTAPTPSSGVSLGAVIGGVVGGVVGLIALIFVVILCCCCCCYSLNKTTQSSVPPATQTSSAYTHPTVVAPVVGYTTTAPYPTADPVKGDYPTTTPVQGGYPTAPVQGGYPTAPVQGGYPTAPVQGGYPTAPVQGGYPEGYSAATPAVYYPTAAPMGYYVPGTTSTIDNTSPPPYEEAKDYPSASGAADTGPADPE